MKNRSLEFELSYQILSKNKSCSFDDIIQNSRNYLIAHFDFDDEWDGLLKTAIFQARGKSPVKVILENDACVIPWEALTEYEMTVSVIGGDLLTSSGVNVFLGDSGAFDGEQSSDEEYWYNQLLGEIDDLKESVSEDAIGREVNEYMKAHPVEMTGYAKTEYVDTQDAGTLKSAKDYADVQLGNVDALLQTI